MDILESFENVGLTFDVVDKVAFRELFKPFYADYIDVKNVINVLEHLGIHENLPNNRKQVDYSKLEGSFVRIFNRINQQLQSKGCSLEEFLGSKNIETVEVVCNGSHHIKAISTKKFSNVLRGCDIIAYGRDLEEAFIDLISISQTCDNYVMIKKLKNILSDIQNCEYFLRFGTRMRKGQFVVQANKLLLTKEAESFFEQNSKEEHHVDISSCNLQEMLNSSDQKVKVRAIIAIWKQGHVYKTVKQAQSKFMNLIRKNKESKIAPLKLSKQVIPPSFPPPKRRSKVDYKSKLNKLETSLSDHSNSLVESASPFLNPNDEDENDSDQLKPSLSHMSSFQSMGRGLSLRGMSRDMKRKRFGLT